MTIIYEPASVFIDYQHDGHMRRIPIMPEPTWWNGDEPDPYENEKPCRWEKFSGICMICGADIGEECEWERDHDRRL